MSAGTSDGESARQISGDEVFEICCEVVGGDHMESNIVCSSSPACGSFEFVVR